MHYMCGRNISTRIPIYGIMLMNNLSETLILRKQATRGGGAEVDLIYSFSFLTAMAFPRLQATCYNHASPCNPCAIAHIPNNANELLGCWVAGLRLAALPTLGVHVPDILAICRLTSTEQHQPNDCVLPTLSLPEETQYSSTNCSGCTLLAPHSFNSLQGLLLLLLPKLPSLDHGKTVCRNPRDVL